MLGYLVRYAADQGLVTEPGFAPRAVRWLLVFSKRGAFGGVVPLGDTTLKRNPGQRFPRCPELSQPEMKAGGPGCRPFLVDKAEVVALHTKGSADRKLRASHDYFVRLLREAGGAVPALRPVAESLASGATLQEIQRRLGEAGAKANDKVSIAIRGIEPEILVDSDAWHDWWRAFRQTLVRPSGRRMVCFASGELVEPARVHKMVEGLRSVGGLPTGDALISFKQESFTSYGLTQSANAAVSEDMASAYRAALNHLLRSAPTLVGTKVVYWFKQQVPREDDPVALAFLDQEDPAVEAAARQRARELLNAIRTGRRPDLRDNHYYAMTLSGQSGRVMTRDWMEGQFENLVESVERWFTDLEITAVSTDRTAREPGLERLVTAVLPLRPKGQDYEDWVRPVGAARVALWRCALDNRRAIPAAVASQALAQHHRFVLSGRFTDAVAPGSRDRGLLLSVLYARMALLKAYILREGRHLMTPHLNEDHPDPAYHCGRLVAMFADLQRAALGDVGAGVVERYYAAASATPAHVLGRLARMSQFHLGKLDGGLAHWYRTRIAEVWGRIKDRVPAALRPEEQTLFALGYYHQIAARRRRMDGTTPDSDEEAENA